MTPDTPPLTKRRWDLIDRLNYHLSSPMPRKKSKKTPKAEKADPFQQEQQQASEQSAASADPPPSDPAQNGSEAQARTGDNVAATPKSGTTRTWYGKTVYPKGSVAAAQAPQERVSLPRSPSMKSEHPYPRQGSLRRPSSKSGPALASLTELNVTSSHSNDSKPDVQNTEPSKEVAPESPLPPEPAKPKKTEEQALDTAAKSKEEEAKRPNTSSGWYMWWSTPDPGAVEQSKDSTKDAAAKTAEDAQKTPLPGLTPVSTPAEAKPSGKDPQAEEPKGSNSQAQPNDANKAAQATSSWFWLWSSTENAKSGADPPPTTQRTPEPQKDVAAANGTVPELNLPPELPREEPTQERGPPQKSSGWAFWSRDKPKSDDWDAQSTHKQVGEIAVADTPSQSNPEAAQFNEHEDTTKEEPPKKEAAKKSKTLRGRPKALLEAETPAPSTGSTPAQTTPAQSPARKAADLQASAAALKKTDLVLPQFSNTYQLAHSPSFWQQVRSYFLGGEAETPHLHITSSPPRIKKALAIGVHGFFPAPLIQKVLGPPTGTSVRFANYAAESIKEWTSNHGYSCDIEKVALEGEGFIADRIDTLWKLLLNWIEQIRSADFVLVACHSQGVPVAISLVAKLIDFGCANARIGVCAMAGVNLGPFAEYKTRLFGGAANELFEFARPNSAVSKNYEAALKTVLRHGVKIVYVGSIDDQLVSLESSTFSNISHPYIYRAVFIDGRLHTPDFLTHLVSLALKLRNLGIPDHGLIRELSPALAGSLYTGDGHSRLYDNPAVYYLAVQHALETTNLAGPVDVEVKRYEGATGSGAGSGGASPNPYFLPWAMRGLLEEDFVRRSLGDEVRELLGSFEEWRPQGKGLKDVRFRLEAVRSKL